MFCLNTAIEHSKKEHLIFVQVYEYFPYGKVLKLPHLSMTLKSLLNSLLNIIQHRAQFMSKIQDCFLPKLLFIQIKSCELSLQFVKGLKETVMIISSQ